MNQVEPKDKSSGNNSNSPEEQYYNRPLAIIDRSDYDSDESYKEI
jgi:hypothetical protein